MSLRKQELRSWRWFKNVSGTSKSVGLHSRAEALCTSEKDQEHVQWWDYNLPSRTEKNSTDQWGFSLQYRTDECLLWMTKLKWHFFIFLAALGFELSEPLYLLGRHSNTGATSPVLKWHFCLNFLRNFNQPSCGPQKIVQTPQPGNPKSGLI
jgi:hypothetical protein